MTLYLSRDRMAKSDQMAAAARTTELSDDVAQQYADATIPEQPSYLLPSLGQLGVTGAPSPVMSAIAAMPSIGQRPQPELVVSPTWALPSLESLGVSQPKRQVQQTQQQGSGEITLEMPEAPEAPAPATYGGGGDSPGQMVGPAPAPGGDLKAYARQQAQRYGLDPDIFERQITQESGWNPQAVSPMGAKGLGQFMPATASSYGLTNPFDPYASLDAAAHHMADNLKANGGDYAKALAAYNAGQGAVNKYGGVPPYEETQNYVRIILGGKTPAAPNAGASPAAPASSAPPAAQPQPTPAVASAGGPSPAAPGQIRIRRVSAGPSGGTVGYETTVSQGDLDRMAPEERARWEIVGSPVAMKTSDVGGADSTAPLSMKSYEPMPEDEGSKWAPDMNQLQRKPSPMRNEVPYISETGQIGEPANTPAMQLGAEGDMQRQPLGDEYDPRDADSGPRESGYTLPPAPLEGDDPGTQTTELAPRGRAEPPVYGPPPQSTAPIQPAIPAVQTARSAVEGGLELAPRELPNPLAPAARVYEQTIEEARADEDKFFTENAPTIARFSRESGVPLEQVHRGLRIARDVVLATPQATADTINAVLEPIGLGRSTIGATIPGLGDVGIADVVDLPGPMSGLTNLGIARGSVTSAANTAATRAAQHIPDLAGAIERGASAAVNAGREAIQGAGRRAGELLEQGRETARRAEQLPGTSLPGTLGISPDEQAMRGLTRSRVVPPDVADTLDFPIRIPEDPATIRAIESIGGTVDPERGVTLNVTRAQGEAAAGGVATRGGVFYEAVPEGGRSSFVTHADDPNAVGGSQVIPPTPTRFRSPLILSDAPGGAGFDGGMQQLGVRRAAANDELTGLRSSVAKRQEELAALRQAGADPGEIALKEDTLRRWQQVLERAESTALPVTSNDIADAIRQARAAGPEGSPARAAAIKEVVSRYGGDPDLIDDLLAIRGADASESAWAIKENILAANARKQGYDGVVTVQPHRPPLAEIDAHPKVVEANAAVAQATKAFDDAQEAYLANPSMETFAAHQKTDEALFAANQAQAAARREAEAALPTHKITELVDVREGRNPTPGVTRQVSLLDTAAQLDDARKEWRRLAAEMQAGRGDPKALDAAMARVAALEQDYDTVLRTGTQTIHGPSGYELREDVKPRAMREREAAEEARRVSIEDQAFNDPAVQAAGRRATAADESLKAARASGDQAAISAAEAERMAAYTEHATLQRAKIRELTAAEGTTASASAGALPSTPGSGILPAVNRAASEAIVGGTGGAVIEQARNPDEDPRTAAGRGFLVGAAGFPLATRAARGAARLAGRTADDAGGALATLGTVPKPNPPAVIINGKVLKASSKPPNLLEIAQSYRHSIGMLGQVGTGLLNAMGGPVSAGSGLATDVIRTGLMKGYPMPAIAEAGSLVAGLGEAARDALGTALGFIPQRVRNAPDFRPPLAERMDGPVSKAMGWVIDTPGRLATQTPDAFFGALFDRMGRRRAANEIMMESGISRLDPVAQMQEVHRLLNAPTPDEAKRITESARSFSDELTYKGPEGYWEGVLSGPFRSPGGPTTANSPTAHQIHDLVGSFLMPFYSSIFKIHKLAATHTPGLGFVADTSKPMSERVARQLVGLGFGIWVADRAAQNLVTGPGPDDPDEKARLKATGWDEWSTYLPGVGYVKSDNLAQAAPFLKTIGAYYDAQRYGSKGPSEGDSLEEGEAVAKKLMRAFEGFPVLRTFSDLYKAAQKPVEGGADMLINAGSSLVPAIVRANEASKDPYQRTVDLNAPLETRIRQRALNRFGSIPGVGSRQDSPPAIDRKGEPIINPRFGINPLIPSTIVKERKPEDPLMTEMGTYGVNLDKPRDRFAFPRDGQSVRVMLKPEWRQEWAEARWQALQKSAPGIQGDPRYAGATETQKRTAWERQVADAESTADRVVKAAHRAEIEKLIETAPLEKSPVRKAS